VVINTRFIILFLIIFRIPRIDRRRFLSFRLKPCTRPDRNESLLGANPLESIESENGCAILKSIRWKDFFTIRITVVELEIRNSIFFFARYIAREYVIRFSVEIYIEALADTWRAILRSRDFSNRTCDIVRPAYIADLAQNLDFPRIVCELV